MKYVTFFFLLLSIFPLKLDASTNLNSINKSICNIKIQEEDLKNINKIKIKKINIDVNKYRNWTVNSVRIITDRSRYVSDRFKQRFKADILVEFEDGSSCKFNGRIRHHAMKKTISV